MTEYLSNKFRWLSLVATWAVVCIHSRTDRWAVGVEDYATRIEASISDLFHFAVPLFFVISGYMFVNSFKKYGWWFLLKRKLWSLYVPMVLWCIICLVLCLPIKIYSGKDIPTVIDLIKPIVMIFPAGTAHFWYVRALIVLFAIAPVVFYLSRFTWTALLLSLGMLLIPADSVAAHLHVPVATIFFILGVQLSIHTSWFQKRLAIGFLVSLAGLAISFCFKEQITAHYFSVLYEPVFMIGILWYGYDLVNAVRPIGKFPKTLEVLFFVYCMHIITLCWCGGILRVTMGNSSAIRLLAYFALWLTFALDVAIANGVRKLFPRVFKILAGGR